jgi:3-dehydroquinate dehydratase-1
MKACVVISESNIKLAISIAQKFEMAEIRLDLCQFRNQHIKDIFSPSTITIATYREKDSSYASVGKIESLKKAIEAGANYIDIELELNARQREDLIAYSKGFGTKIIISHHNFEKTPPIELMKDKIELANSLGAHITKIVTKVNFRDDCLTLFNLYKGAENLIAFGMGEDAKFTRITALFLGAPFAYVYYLGSKKVAEGQLSYKEFESAMKGIS